MGLKRCENGHFYNGSKYAECPKCLAIRAKGGGDSVTMQMGGSPSSMPMGGGPGAAPGGGDSMTAPIASQDGRTAPMQMGGGLGAGEDSVTVAMPRAQQEDSVTVPLAHMPAPGYPEPPGRGNAHDTSLQAAVRKAAGTDDDGKTVSFYQSKKGVEPVVGWLVCVEGDDFGASFTLKAGRNFIGRSETMDVVLHGDSSISRERHAIIVYEPKRREFIAQAGESRELFYLNEEVVLNPVRINQYDIITVGNTKLMFFPCCGENFSWDDIENDAE